MKQSVEVEIAGQQLIIRSDEGPAYVQELAAYVDAQMQVVAPGARASLNVQRAALLVAIQLADELFREKDLHRRFRRAIGAKLEHIEGALDEHATLVEALAPPAEPSPHPLGDTPLHDD